MLGDGAQTLILTVHGYGYRYTGAVEVLGDPALAPPAALATELRVDAEPPLRPLWRLRRQLESGSDVWLAEHLKTGERRVLKFASTVAGVTALKRELTILRLLRKALGKREDFVRLLDYNLEAAPYFLELEYHELGSFSDWLATPEGRQSTLDVRLALLARAADALAAAHAVGVLHQDIKPANLLIGRTEAGELTPCWTDFGIGGVNRERLDHYQLTAMGMTGVGTESSGGTLTYLAPERIAGAPATIRADIYALGVLLYQVCVGDVGRTFAPGWERDIPDDLLREDIGACADIDPDRRLGDAAELAHRLRSRDARRDAQAQQLAERQRLRIAEQAVERNRQRRGALLLVIVALSIGAVTSSWQWRRAEREQRNAKAALDEAVAVNDFMNDEVFSSADPYVEGGGKSVTVASVLESASKRLDENHELSPAAAARLGLTLGGSFYDLGLLMQARTRLVGSLKMSEQQLGTDAETTTNLRMRLADVYGEQDQIKEAERLYLAVELTAAREGPIKGRGSSQRARSGLGWTAYVRGAYAESAQILQPLIAEFEAETEAELSPRLETLAYARWNLSETLIELNRFAEAHAAVNKTADYLAITSGQDSPLIDWVHETDVTLLLAEGRPTEALALASKIASRAQLQLSVRHGSTQLANYQMGIAYLQMDRFEDARRTLADALKLRRAISGNQHVATLMVASALASAELVLGDVEGALTLSRETDQSARSLFGEDHPRRLAMALVLGNALAAHGDLTGAKKQLEDAMRIGDRTLPANHRLRAELRTSLGRVAQIDHRSAEARQHYADALKIFDAGLGASHPRTRAVKTAVDTGQLPAIAVVSGSPS